MLPEHTPHQFESHPRSLWAPIFRHVPQGVMLTWSRCPWVTMGIGMPPENTERSRVFTITITAPQQAHRIGAREREQIL